MSYHMFYHKIKVKADPLTRLPMYEEEIGEEDVDCPLELPECEPYTEELNHHIQEALDETDEDY